MYEDVSLIDGKKEKKAGCGIELDSSGWDAAALPLAPPQLLAHEDWKFVFYLITAFETIWGCRSLSRDAIGGSGLKWDSIRFNEFQPSHSNLDSDWRWFNASYFNTTSIVWYHFNTTIPLYQSTTRHYVEHSLPLLGSSVGRGSFKRWVLTWVQIPAE